jgi:putative glycosyltransferase (TIGR04372 family)
MTFIYNAKKQLGTLHEDIGFLRKYCFYNSLDGDALYNLYKAYKSRGLLYDAIVALVYALSGASPQKHYQECLNRELSDLGFESVKIAILKVHRIGHLTLEPDSWLRKNAHSKNSKCLYIFINGGNISNDFVLDLISTKLTVCNSEYWYGFYGSRPLLMKDEYYEKMPFDLSSLRRGGSIIDLYSELAEVFRATPSQIAFPSEKVNNIKEILIKKGIKDFTKIVCFHVRDSAYLSEEFPNNSHDYNDVRDMNINNYSKGIDYLLNQNYIVIRLGKTSNQSLSVEHENYYDFCIHRDEHYGEEIEAFLLSICQFFIGTSSGILSLASMFDTPTLAVNVTPYVPNYGRNTVFIPKILLDSNGNQVNFHELFDGKSFEWNNKQINLLNCHDTRILIKAGFSFVENDNEDIFAAIKEFSEKVRNRALSLEPTDLQKQYWNSIPDDVWIKGANSTVSDSFLRRHNELFKLKIGE